MQKCAKNNRSQRPQGPSVLVIPWVGRTRKWISENEKNNLLIFVDESEEYLDAMKYACEVAEKNRNNIILLYVIEEENFRHWKGVEKIMRDEQNDKAKDVLNKHISYIRSNFSLEV